MNKDLYHMIKNTQKVTGFLGGAGTPAKVSDKEIDKWLISKKARMWMINKEINLKDFDNDFFERIKRL